MYIPRRALFARGFIGIAGIDPALVRRSGNFFLRRHPSTHDTVKNFRSCCSIAAICQRAGGMKNLRRPITLPSACISHAAGGWLGRGAPIRWPFPATWILRFSRVLEHKLLKAPTTSFQHSFAVFCYL